MALDNRLQCTSTFQSNQLWHAKRTINRMSLEQKQQLLEKIQAETILLGKEVKNQEIYKLLKEKSGEKRPIS